MVNVRICKTVILVFFSVRPEIFFVLDLARPRLITQNGFVKIRDCETLEVAQ